MNSHPAGCIVNFLEHGVEGFSASLRGVNVELRQLDCGQFAASTTSVALGGLRLHRRCSNLRHAVKGSMPSGVVFCLPLTPLPLFINGCRIEPDIQLVSTGARELFAVMPARFEYLLLRLDDAELRQHLGATGASTFLARAAHSDHCPVDVRAKEALARGLSETCRELQERDSAPDPQQQLSLRQSIVRSLDAYLAGLRPGPRRQPGSRERLLYRALHLLESDPLQSWTLGEMAAATFASKRALQYAFDLLLGMSPMRYAKLHRLNMIRRELSAPGSGLNLVRLAGRYGFSNPGRLAREYAGLFAESPRDTMRRNVAPRVTVAGGSGGAAAPA